MNSWIWMLVILTVFNYRAWNRNCQLNFPGAFDWGQHAWFTFLRKWFWIREVYLTLSSSDALCINRSISEQLSSSFCWWWHKDWGKGGSQKKKNPNSGWEDLCSVWQAWERKTMSNKYMHMSPWKACWRKDWHSWGLGNRAEVLHSFPEKASAAGSGIWHSQSKEWCFSVLAMQQHCYHGIGQRKLEMLI